MADPFAVHPELRGLIRDPSQSALRNLYVSRKGKDVPAPPGLKTRSDDEREVSRLATLARRSGQ